MTKASSGHGGRRINQTGRPPKPPKEKLIKGSLALLPDEREKLLALAKAQKTNVNTIIRQAIRALPDPEKP